MNEAGEWIEKGVRGTWVRGFPPLRPTTPATHPAQRAPGTRCRRGPRGVAKTGHGASVLSSLRKEQMQEQPQILRLRYASLRKTNLIESKKSQAEAPHHDRGNQQRHGEVEVAVQQTIASGKPRERTCNCSLGSRSHG